jgi:predicted ArsR family transcriptional regulator
MTFSPLLRLLLPVEETTINELAERTGADRRALRIALLAASADDMVEVDRTYTTWRLTDRGRQQLHSFTIR